MLDETHVTAEHLLAFADGRRDLVSDEAIKHMQMCPACNDEVDILVNGRASLRNPLQSAFVPQIDLGSLVARVVATTTDTKLAMARRRSALTAAAMTFAVAAIMIATSAMTSWRGIGSLLRGVETTFTVVRGLTTLIERGVPGGAGTLALVGAVVVMALYAIGKTMLRSSHVAGTLLLLAGFAISPRADAQLPDAFGGQWPSVEADARVSVDVTRKPMSYALERVSKSAKLDLVFVSNEDPLVTLHLRNAPLQDALAAIVAGRNLRVTRSASRLQIVEAQSAPATETAPAPPSDAPASATQPRTAPAAPVAAPTVPPALPPASATPPLASPPIAAPPSPRFPSNRPSQGERATVGNDATVGKDEKVLQVITMGGDANILGEVERDVVTMGGDAIISGYVGGDVVTMGGDLHIKAGSEIGGEVATMGGEVHVDDGATPPRGSAQRDAAHSGDKNRREGKDEFRSVLGRVNEHGSNDSDSHASSFFGRMGQFGLLCVIGLLFLGVAPSRFETIQNAVQHKAPQMAALGLVVALGSTIATVVLTLTFIGIPLALVVALSLTVSVALGLAMSGYALGLRIAPARLRDKPIACLAVGLGVLFVASYVPIVGVLTLALAALLGIGALAQTKLGTMRV